MKSGSLTNSELLVLGLVAEMPRHGYELEQTIQRRGMREWTQIGLSSIYFVLGSLERKGLVKSEVPASAKAKKRYKISVEGKKTLKSKTLAALNTIHPASPSLFVGMLHWQTLTRAEALTALQSRKIALKNELERIENIRFAQQPLPDYVDALFEYCEGQLKAEAQWAVKTLDYMRTKPWSE
jgi:DNA-binding PadR family transcriptional regulator